MSQLLNLIKLFHVLTVNLVHKKTADKSVFMCFNVQPKALRVHIDFQSGKKKRFLLHKVLNWVVFLTVVMSSLPCDLKAYCL